MSAGRRAVRRSRVRPAGSVISTLPFEKSVPPLTWMRTSTPAKGVPPRFCARTRIWDWPPPGGSSLGSDQAATTTSSLAFLTGSGGGPSSRSGGREGPALRQAATARANARRTRDFTFLSYLLVADLPARGNGTWRPGDVEAGRGMGPRPGGRMKAPALVRRAAALALRLAGALAFLPPLLTRLVIGYAFYQTGQGKLANPDRIVEFFT